MKPKGFTLVELIILVAVGGIVASAAIPNFIEAQTKSDIAKAKSGLCAVQAALEPLRRALLGIEDRA